MGGRDSMSTATNKWPVYMCKQVNNILKNRKKKFQIQNLHWRKYNKKISSSEITVYYFNDRRLISIEISPKTDWKLL